MNLSVPRLLYSDLRLIVEKLQSPVAILDAGGSLDTLSAAALPLWQTFKLNGDWLAQNDRPKETLSTILPRLLSLNIPTWIAGLDDMLLIATPLSEALNFGPDIKKQPVSGGYWLEWLSGWDQASASAEVTSLSEQLAIYQDVAQAVNSSLVLEDIFESLADVIARYIPYDEAVILILDPSQNGIKLLVKMYPDGTLDISGENNAFAGYDPVVDLALKNQQTQTYPAPKQQQLPDVSEFGVPKSLVVADGAKGAIIVPLINKGIVIGLISLSSLAKSSTNATASYNTAHKQLLLQISTQLAVAVENARLYWQTQAQASREFLINQLTMAIRQSLDIDMILSTAVMELGKVLGVSRCYIRYFESALTQAENTSSNNPDTTQIFKNAFKNPSAQELGLNGTSLHSHTGKSFRKFGRKSGKALTTP